MDNEKLVKYHTIIMFCVGLFFTLVQDFPQYAVYAVFIFASASALCAFMFLTRRIIPLNIRIHIISNGSFLFAFGCSVVMETVPNVFTMYLSCCIVGALYFKKSVIVGMAIAANTAIVVCIWIFKLGLPGGEFDGLWFFNNMVGLNIGIVLIFVVTHFGKGFFDRLQSALEESIKQGELLSKAIEEAQEANKSKSNFLAVMSHEIRTPLNAILGIAQIQMHQDDLPDKYADAFDKIQNSGNALLGIINDILDLSKIETGKLELAPVDYDIPSFINDTVQLNAVRIGSRPIEFILEVDENLPSRLLGDELRLKQILNNLLSNAVKYTGKGHVILSVSTKECISNDSNNNEIILVFSVSDTGQGMKSEDMERLFTEYQRFNMEANRSTEGTGLGLTITKKLVSMMNGDISVESKYGIGSIFTVTVPQKIMDSTPIGAKVAANLCGFAYVNKSKERRKVLINPMPYGSVLVVDDVESNLLVAKGLLSPYKLKIETADSGFEAIEKVENGNVYDIIFMDHMMPRMDGIETTQKIRGRGYKGVIVALTANALVGNDEKFIKNGFDGYISKPIDIRRLDVVLNKFIRDKYPEEAKKYKQETSEAKRPDISEKHMKLFLKEAEKAVVTLRETTANGDIKLFTTTVHALKTSIGYIGEKELSGRAAALEKAGNSGDTEFIAANTEGFIETLIALIDNLRPAETDNSENADVSEDIAFLVQQLAITKTACENYDDKAAYAALDSLKLKLWKKETLAALEDIRDTLFLNSDFEEAEKKTDALMELASGGKS